MLLHRSVALPVHLALATALARRNGDVCATQALANPGAQRLTRHAYELLDALRFNLLRAPGPVTLPPVAQCTAVLTHLHIVLGFLLPAMAQMAAETRQFAEHQRERRECGLPPEKGMEAALHSALDGLLEVLFWPQALLALWMLAGISFDLALLGAGACAPAVLAAGS